jgi:Derlin-2/3
MAEINGFFAWYYEIPFVSRMYITLAIAITTACYMEYVSPLTLYYNSDLILQKGQYWRIFTSFLFFGTFSLDFFFHLYFVTRYSRLLEEGYFRGRAADFLFMLFFGAVLLLATTTYFDVFSRVKFLGHPLSFMMVYIWSRDPENAYIRMNFFVLDFNAPILPWVMLGFSLLLGSPIETDLLGIIVGHCYYYLEHVYPRVAEIRQWPIKKLIFTPPILHYLLNSDQMFAFLNTGVSSLI